MGGEDMIIPEIVNGILDGIKDAIIQPVIDSIESMLQDMMGLLVAILSTNPSLDSLHPLWKDFVSILMPTYTLIFILAGLYFLFSCLMNYEPTRIFQEFVVKTIISMLLVITSFDILYLKSFCICRVDLSQECMKMVHIINPAIQPFTS